jgi:hypothetical protein
MGVGLNRSAQVSSETKIKETDLLYTDEDEDDYMEGAEATMWWDNFAAFLPNWLPVIILFLFFVIWYILHDHLFSLKLVWVGPLYVARAAAAAAAAQYAAAFASDRTWRSSSPCAGL